MPKHKHVIKAEFKNEEVDTQDGGQAKIISLCNKPDEENGMFVQLRSWDENLEHKEFKKFIGRKIKITIETID
jgi:hypothetical protein